MEKILKQKGRKQNLLSPPVFETMATKETSDNVVQPGFKPGYPDYWSDALTARSLFPFHT